MRIARLLVLLFALTLPATPARALNSGVAIRWDQCLGDGDVSNKGFACDTNTGSEHLVGSFVLPVNMTDVTGLEIVIDVAIGNQALVPAWWLFRNLGTCRQPSLTVNLDQPGTNCPDWSQLHAVGGIGAYRIAVPGPNTTRIVSASAVAPAYFQSLGALTEYYGINLNIDHAKTVGTGACDGCTTPACIVLSSVNVLTWIQANHRVLTGPANATDSDFATWQGGGGIMSQRGSGCPAATPPLQRTWGAVKALYR